MNEVAHEPASLVAFAPVGFVSGLYTAKLSLGKLRWASKPGGETYMDPKACFYESP